MIRYRAIGMLGQEAARLRRLVCDDFGHPVLRRTEAATYPCRFTLAETSAAGGMLLLSWQAPLPKSLYGHPTAIFLSAGGGNGFARPDVVPEIVANRSVSFRAFGHDGLMLYEAGEVVADGGHDAAVRRILARDGVAFVNAHTIGAGCFLCRFERS